ncbi:hypothetical protein SS50377_24119 [Spironucleus salmonicida]|uniref:SNF7 family protein n=1 Tax=Spironucleus salmonicida TaxID=348837 RepID=V6LK37_9EUKA|nr:hypothetical protein SS50377_24119 [Spironucleus salmonicida]|eukprot:EST44101.1 hypothetical protein SS50377_16100 [Spironucleus salmonicida]
MGGSQSLQDIIFDMNFQAKQLQKQADKSLSESNACREKAKQLLVQNQRELAQQQAQLSSVKNSQAISLQKLSTQLTAHVGELKLMAAGNQVSGNIKQVNHQLSKLLKAQDVIGAAKLLEDYQQNSGEMAMKQDVMQGVLQENMDGAAGVNKVQDIMVQLEIEAGIDSGNKLQGLGMTQEEKELQQRIDDL